MAAAGSTAAGGGNTAVAGPAIQAGGAVAGATISGKAGKHAADKQFQSSVNALEFARSQEAERKREWDIQQAQAQAQWKARQDMLRPFNQAAYSVLGAYGVPVSMQDQAMPAGAGVTPTGVTPTAKQPVVPTGGTKTVSTMGDMMTPKPAGAFDWQSPFAKVGAR